MKTTHIICDFCEDEIFGGYYQVVITASLLGGGMKEYHIHDKCAKKVRKFIDKGNEQA